MPDLADIVIDQVKKKFPDAAPKLKVAEIQGLLSLGKFDEVQKIIDAIPDKRGAEYWAMTLAKADTYFSFGKHEEAEKLYKRFFAANARPTPALASFYRDSAYKYAQMLLYIGRDKDALEAYNLLSAVKLDEELARRILAEKAELMLKLAPLEKNVSAKNALLMKADKVADKLLWKQDLWFGKAVVFKAHILMLQGKSQEADELVETYMTQLKTIHDSLREQDPDGTYGMLRMSPMPQCRFLLGAIKEKEAMKLADGGEANNAKILDLLLGSRNPQTKKRKGNGAYNHFLNVFIRYPESQWAGECGQRAEKLRAFIQDRFNTKIRQSVTSDQMAKVRQMQFANAQLAFSQNQYKEAIVKYEEALSRFPEVPESVDALGNLAICYIDESYGGNITPEEKEFLQLSADTVVGHISERFSEKPDMMRSAGDQLRRIGEHYGEMKLKAKRLETYELFFRDYPNHYAAAQLMMSFAQTAYNSENYPTALGYYKSIATSYTNSPYYYDALSRVSQCYAKMGETTNSIAALQTYVSKLAAKDSPGHMLITGQYRLASQIREYGVSLIRNGETNESATAEQKADWIKEGSKYIAQAAKNFAGVSRLLQNPDAYQLNSAERKVNSEIKENSALLYALSLTMLQSDNAETKKKLRLGAIKAFEKFVAEFPKSKSAPLAQLRIGTLYTINEDMKNAQEALDKLAKEYPNSEQAKNSVPMLAAALIEMGLKGEGVAKYRQMLSAGGKYTAGQFLNAAIALEGAREFELALQAYDKVLEMSKDIGHKAICLIGKAKCLQQLKRSAEAHRIVDEFIADKNLSKLQQFVDANMLLVDIASSEAKNEKNESARISLFNAAVDAIKKVRAYKRPRDIRNQPIPQSKWTPAQRLDDARLRLLSAEVVLRQLDAERKFGTKETVAETRGKVLANMQSGMLMSMDTSDEAIAPVIEDLCYKCVPLLIEHGHYEDAIADCDLYLKLFPKGRWVTEITTFRNQAKTELDLNKNKK